MEMDTSDVLLASLNELFGIEGIQDSSYRKITEHFDRDSGDRVIWIEYRYKAEKLATQHGRQNTIVDSIFANAVASIKT